VTATVLVLNGPNLGRLGTREPEVYGTTTYAQLVELCEQVARDNGLSADVRQTDDEATMLGWLHEAAGSATPVVINPGAWSHYSYALRDAVAMVPFVVEVHISQTHAREAFRHHSVVSAVVRATLTGLGVDGYRAAIEHLARA
jgi:3-dehydroquinate dehydratase-2